jgi:hypothetical protein
LHIPLIHLKLEAVSMEADYNRRKQTNENKIK